MFAWAAFPSCATEEMRSLENTIFKHIYTDPEAVVSQVVALKAMAQSAHCMVVESRAHSFLATIHSWRNQLDSSLYHAGKALSLAWESGDTVQISAAYNMKGVIYDLVGQLDSAYRAYDQSYAWGLKGQDKKSVARALLNMGMIHRTRGEYLKSLECLHEAKEHCIRWNLLAYMPNLHLTIGEVYLMIGEDDLAWEHLSRSLYLARLNSKPRIMAAAMEALGQYAEVVQDTVEALCWYEESLRLAQESKIAGQEGRSFARVAVARVTLGQVEEAGAAAQTAIKIARRDQDTVTLSQALLALGLVNLRQGQPAAAYGHCDHAHGLAVRASQTNALLPICDCLWRSAEASGQGLKALRHYREYAHLRDSLLNRDNTLAIARLEARLDYAQQRAADSLLQAARAVQQEATHRAELAVEQERSRIGFWLSASAALLAIAGGVVVMVFLRQNRRLSTQNQLIQIQNGAIHSALQEKEVLLREVHHRVKNNLQVMISLLEMQSEKVMDANALHALRASKSRVQAMTLIHQKLYQQENIATLEFGTYLRELVEAVQQLYPHGKQVTVSYQFDACNFGIDAAVPLGLILNELVTNAFKYAYVGRDSGVLRLSLHSLNGRGYAFGVEDDGPGMMDGVDVQKLDSLGMQLVEGLTRQIKGTLLVGRSSLGGAQFSIIFQSLTP